MFRLLQSSLSVVICFCLVGPAAAAVRGKNAVYMGGTLKTLSEKTEGQFDVSDEKAARFVLNKGAPVLIPYERITSLEYGQKAGRRVGVALAVSPVFLFSKKRKHFLTIGFKDNEGASQGAVFELSKGTVGAIAKALETRSDKKIEFESEEAQKHFEKEAK